MMLDIIERDHGRDLAEIVADMCLHARGSQRGTSQKSAFSHVLGSHNPHLIAAVKVMNEHIENPLDMGRVAARTGISRRQLERLFGRHLGVTPARFYMELRVARAHALLNETAMSVGEIALATGFASASQLAQRFRRRHGASPGAYRRRAGTPAARPGG